MPVSRHPDDRLDQPLESRRSFVPRSPYSRDAFGRLAEFVARFIGTARFLAAQSALIVIWVGYNLLGPRWLTWDRYPFQFLNVMLSLQAAYAAPLILLAQNRQDDRDRVNLEQDRSTGGRTLADIEYLTREVAALRTAIGDVATRDFIRSEIRGLLEELSPEDEEAS